MDLQQAAFATAKLLEMRGTLKRVMGPGYDETLAGWKRSVRQVMARDACNPIVAFNRLGEAAREAGSDGVTLLWLAAAAVEITEEDANA